MGAGQLWVVNMVASWLIILRLQDFYGRKSLSQVAVRTYDGMLFLLLCGDGLQYVETIVAWQVR